MSTILTCLSMAQFDATANAEGASVEHMLARLKTTSIMAENDQIDGRGIADRYELGMNVKQGQSVDFTVFQIGPSAGSGGEPLATNLDVSLWTIGGTAFLGLLRSGSLEITTATKEGSGVSAAYKYPVAVGTKVQLTSQVEVGTYSGWMNTLLTGVATAFDVTASATIGGEAFSMPMTMKSGKHTVDREEIQQVEMVLTGKGTPTGPTGNSLIGNILLGSAQVALAIDTGGGSYSTASMMFALITKLNVKVEDAQIIEISGTFEFQGPATYAHP
jgi:hypothetical protein